MIIFKVGDFIVYRFQGNWLETAIIRSIKSKNGMLNCRILHNRTHPEYIGQCWDIPASECTKINGNIGKLL